MSPLKIKKRENGNEEDKQTETVEKKRKILKRKYKWQRERDK